MPPTIFITPHAVGECRKRGLFPRCDRQTTEARLRECLRCPAFRVPLSHATLWGLLSPEGFPFLVATDPADESAPFLLVRTAGPWWFWHEARPFWKQTGIVKKTGDRWHVIPPYERRTVCP